MNPHSEPETEPRKHAKEIQQLRDQLAAAQAAIKYHNDSPVLYEIPYNDTTALDAAIAEDRKQFQREQELLISVTLLPLVKLLQRSIRIFPNLVARTCGNVEGTPCDDHKRSYVCSAHRWLKDARAALAKVKEGK